MFVCASDLSVLWEQQVEVSIAEKTSLRCGRLTPGKQMCSTRTGAKPRSIYPCPGKPSIVIIVSSRGSIVQRLCEFVSIAEQHIVSSPPTDLSLKTWALQSSIMMSVSCCQHTSLVWRGSTKDKACLPCWDQSLHICVSAWIFLWPKSACVSRPKYFWGQNLRECVSTT